MKIDSMDKRVKIELASVTDKPTLAWLRRVGKPVKNSGGCWLRVTARQYHNRPGVIDTRPAEIRRRMEAVARMKSLAKRRIGKIETALYDADLDGPGD